MATTTYRHWCVYIYIYGRAVSVQFCSAARYPRRQGNPAPFIHLSFSRASLRYAQRPRGCQPTGGKSRNSELYECPANSLLSSPLFSFSFLFFSFFLPEFALGEKRKKYTYIYLSTYLYSSNPTDSRLILTEREEGVEKFITYYTILTRNSLIFKSLQYRTNFFFFLSTNQLKLALLLFCQFLIPLFIIIRNYETGIAGILLIDSNLNDLL